MSITVRPAQRADVEEIAALHVSTWRETYGDRLPADFFTDEHRRMRVAMWSSILETDRPGLIARVAVDADRIIGFGLAGPSTADEAQHPPRERTLYNLYVERAAHGTGVGQSLIDAIAGAEPMMLWVASANARAIAFYRRNGFAFDGAEQTDADVGITESRMLR